MDAYDPHAIERKWQQVWDEAGAFVTPEPGRPGRTPTRDKAYVLEMLPYPSGELHMGHVLNYTLGDVVSHFRRRSGYSVLRPMGYDAFGLPAENAAIREGGHPREVTERNIAAIRAQIKRMGWSIDWTREVSTARARVLPLDAVALPAAATRPGSPTARRRRSSGARTTRPCSRTSR